MNLSLVPVGAISQYLLQLLPYLRESARRARGRATVDDILRFVLTGQMQLWAVYEGAPDAPAIRGHVITEVKQYPQCKMFVVQYCAMRAGTLAQVEEQLQEVAQLAARDAGCAGIEFVGRPGWRLTARKYGYNAQSVVYQKFFEESQ